MSEPALVDKSLSEVSNLLSLSLNLVCLPFVQPVLLLHLVEQHRVALVVLNGLHLALWHQLSLATPRCLQRQTSTRTFKTMIWSGRLKCSTGPGQEML